VDERAEFESGERAIDQVEESSLAEKRAAVHELGRTAARRMRGDHAD
jgi:hypothetical protein